MSEDEATSDAALTPPPDSATPGETGESASGTEEKKRKKKGKTRKEKKKAKGVEDTETSDGGVLEDASGKRKKKKKKRKVVTEIVETTEPAEEAIEGEGEEGPQPVPHFGEWRGGGKRAWCSRANKPDGMLCEHGPDIIKEEHWSCCGQTQRSCSCTGVKPAERHKKEGGGGKALLDVVSRLRTPEQPARPAPKLAGIVGMMRGRTSPSPASQPALPEELHDTPQPGPSEEVSPFLAALRRKKSEAKMTSPLQLPAKSPVDEPAPALNASFASQPDSKADTTSEAGGLRGFGSRLMGTVSSGTGLLKSFLRKGDDILARLLGEEEPDREIVFTDAPPAAPASVVSTERTTERSYNLKRVPYLHPEEHTEPSYWILRSGLPFPSYHENPTRDLPARWTDIKGVKNPVEDIRAPRIREAPYQDQLIMKSMRFREAVKIRALEDEEVKRIHTINLSYQDLGDGYQADNLTTFLDMNRGVERLALTDNQLITIGQVHLPFLKVLHLSRNQFLTFNTIPAFPSLERMHLSYNFISNMEGCDNGKYPRLVELTLKGNPISDDKNYHKLVKRAVPTVTTLDSYPLVVKGVFNTIK
eukprot:Sspe_Gene.34821::Locus_16908_Transcript_3_4_Confidence_0.400_Length_1816::g.34821::m.34821